VGVRDSNRSGGKAKTRCSINTEFAEAKDPTTLYAKKVVAGTIMAGPYVRAAAQRHLNDLEGGAARGLVFDRAAAQRAISFFPDMLKIDGNVIDPETGEETPDAIPFVLLPCWQFVVGAIFGWKWKATGRRRYRTAYIEGGKGSAKTPLAAGVGLYMMLADGELSAEIYAAGAKRDQAMILFGDVTKMIDRSPILRRKLAASGKNPVWQWTHRPTGSFFKPLSSDKKKSGQRVYAGLVDELHEHKDRYTIDMLVAGFKGRKQPLLFVITNSGFDRDSVCWEYHDHACAVAEGLREDDTFFSYVMAVDEDDDPLEDESCWEKTNPGIDVTITREYLRSRVNDARMIPGREGEVLRLNFCQWTDAEIGWMTRGTWAACEAPLIEGWKDGAAIAPMFAGAECYMAIDLSFAFDLTALAFIFPEGDQHLAWIEYFTPKDTARERERVDNKPYMKWIDQGLIHGVPGKVVRKEHVASRIAQALDQFDVRRIAFDRYRHKELREEMDELGIHAPWIEHPQGFRRAGQLPFPEFRGADGKAIDNPLWMPDSVEKLETRLIEKLITVHPSPVTRWQVSSVVIRPDPAGTGNRVFDKRKSTGRIDGMVTLAMAEGAADMRLPVNDLSGFLNRPVMVGA
jgi:phage terminase large subunit-like protein